MSNDKYRSRPKRHCMVVFAHYPAGETRVQRQTELLLDNGYEVDIICLRVFRSKNEAPSEIINGAHVYRLPVSRTYGTVDPLKQFLEYLAFFFRAMIALIRLHPRRRYGVVQVHNLPDFLVFAAWFPKLFGARLILDLHDLMPEFYAARIGRSMDNWLVRLVTLQERLSCRFADHVITVTELWRETLIRHGVPPEKVSVIMNVADDRIFKRDGHAQSAQDARTFHLFYHGALVPRYGIDLVFEAIARLHNEIPELQFTVHGGSSGGYKEHLKQLAKQLGIDDYVRFNNRLYPMAELPALISVADVGIVPYRRDRFTDGILPTKLMEYTALGIPAIAARTSAIAAYFDETMVQFFTPGDVDNLVCCLRMLYADRERLAMLAANADKFNQLYNWSSIGVQYLALVERLSSR